MAHPHLLSKTFAEITAATRSTIVNLYGGAQPKDPEDVWLRYHTARGVLMLWSDICFDMGASPLINVQAQNELEALVRELDNAGRNLVGMPYVGQ